MLFDDWKDKSPLKISSTLLWDYDLSTFDWEKGKLIVVQRIVEKRVGQRFLCRYTIVWGLRSLYRNSKTKYLILTKRDMNFVSKGFSNRFK